MHCEFPGFLLPVYNGDHGGCFNGFGEPNIAEQNDDKKYVIFGFLQSETYSQKYPFILHFI